MSQNFIRGLRAKSALDHYAKELGTDINLEGNETTAIDLLTDMRNLFSEEEFQRIIDISESHHDIEKEQED